MDCSYADADDFEGWGWNAVTNEPCPPLEDTSGSDEALSVDASSNDTQPVDATDNSSNTLGSDSGESVGTENTNANEQTTDVSVPSSNSGSSSGGGSIYWPLLVLLLGHRRCALERIFGLKISRTLFKPQ